MRKGQGRIIEVSIASNGNRVGIRRPHPYKRIWSVDEYKRGDDGLDWYGVPYHTLREAKAVLAKLCNATIA